VIERRCLRVFIHGFNRGGLVNGERYSIFTSSAYRTYTVKWRFPQEIATLHDAAMSISEVKML
jgi:hypothetical protein